MRLLVGLFFLNVPRLALGAESSPTLTVTTTEAVLYVRQDVESKVVATLEKGEVLKPLAQGVGIATWYMVKTPKGQIGWVQSADVSSSNRTDEVFRDSSKLKAPNRPTGSLAECLARADEEHQRTWAKTCEEGGKRSDCPLTGSDADVLKRDHRAARDECIKLHGIDKLGGAR